MCRADTGRPVSPVARFRPFGRRQDGPESREPDPWLDDPPPRARAADRAAVGWDERDHDRPGPVSVPATRAASPAMWAPRPLDPVEPLEDDRAPVTDPFGFPPVPPVSPVAAARQTATAGRDDVPAWAAWVPERSPGPAVPARADGADRRADRDPLQPDPLDPGPREPGPLEPDRAEPDRLPAARTGSGPSDGDPPVPVDPAPLPDPAEAAALAGAFAADYLSWDEDDPARRGRALSDHLPSPGDGHALLGWSGAGRQRADIVLPGAVRPDGDGRLLVDVRVRVTPYRRVSRSEATPEPDPRDALGTPAAAPSVTARGWRGLAARWVRLGVTIVRDGDGLVVDAGEETFDEPDERRPPVPAPPRTARPAEDPTLDGDDVVAAGSRR